MNPKRFAGYGLTRGAARLDSSSQSHRSEVPMSPADGQASESSMFAAQVAGGPAPDGGTERNDPAALPLLRMTGIIKRFAGVTALGGVDLEVLPGEVHCLLGQNGAGKSTLIKILAGVHRPDEGDLSWRGEIVEFADPAAAVNHGIATIYQDLDLVDGLSVAENIFLGHENSTLGFTRRSATAHASRALLVRLGHPEISPTLGGPRPSTAQEQSVPR